MSLAADIPGDISSSAVLAVGGEVASTVDFPGDENWFRVELVADQICRFDLRSDVGSATPLGDPYLRLYDTAGNLIAENGDGFGLDSRLFLTAFETATYFASAGGLGETTGDYRLAARLVDVSGVIPGDPSSSATLEVGGEAAGTVEVPGDQDWYRTQLTAGQVYRFDLLADDSGGDPLGDLALRIHDGNGVLLSERFGTSFYNATATGLFFVSAGTFSFQATGDYRLVAGTIDLSGDIATLRRRGRVGGYGGNTGRPGLVSRGADGRAGLPLVWGFESQALNVGIVFLPVSRSSGSGSPAAVWCTTFPRGARPLARIIAPQACIRWTRWGSGP